MIYHHLLSQWTVGSHIMVVVIPLIVMLEQTDWCTYTTQLILYASCTNSCSTHEPKFLHLPLTYVLTLTYPSTYTDPHTCASLHIHTYVRTQVSCEGPMGKTTLTDPTPGPGAFMRTDELVPKVRTCHACSSY